MTIKSMMSLAVAVSLVISGGCSDAKAQDNEVRDNRSYVQPGGVMYFFEAGLPDTLSYSDSSTVGTSTVYRKDGEASLEWRFHSGDSLFFEQPIGYENFVANETDQSKSTFATWIYNNEPQDQPLRFVFLTDGKQDAWFEISLNFSGWRQLLIPFEDMQGQPSEEMNELQIIAGAALKSSVLYFDQMMMSIPVDPRWPTRDVIVPYINLSADVAPNRHWLALLRYSELLAQHYSDLVSADTVPADLDRIYSKLDSFIFSSGDTLEQSVDITALKDKYAHYRLTELDGTMLGEPLDNRNRLQIFLNKGINKGLLDQTGFETVFGVQKLRAYGEFMLELAKAMHGDISVESKQELADMYIALTRYALVQGYTSGSALGTSHHMGYTLRALFQAHYLCRDLLAENLLQDEISSMMAWFSGTGRIFRPVSEMTNFNVDVMNTQLRGMLYSILMQTDVNRRNAWLQQFSFWLSQSITHSYGLGGGFKPDGSVFHHAQHYPAYAKGALKGLTPVIDALSRTGYAVTPEAHQVVKHAVAMTEVYSNDGLTLMSVTGRHPDGKQSIEVIPFRHMAEAGTPDGDKAMDPDMAAAYLRLANPSDPFAKQLRQLGVESQSAPQGSWAMNFANMTLQRREDWVASVRGFSRYLVSHESYANANRYGRYINYGQLEIMGPDGASRAFSHDGWNWNRWPGTTAVQLPYKQLKAQLRNVDTFSGLEEMLLSEQSYAGGVSNGRDGMFAIKLQGHPKYDRSFAAHKSVFFFDDRIVALGSGIYTDVAEVPTQTTLFQHAIRQSSDQVWVNKIKVGKGDEVAVGSEDSVNVVVDPANNAYFVPASEDLRVSFREQHSVNQKTSVPTSGSFASAVIDHGNAPVDGSYEYAVLINSDAARINSFYKLLKTSNSRPYEVKRKDKRAHVVWDRQSNTTGYAVYEPNVEFTGGPLAAIDTPAMVMVKQGEGELHLSMVNPDLNLYQGKEPDQYDENGIQKEVSIYSRKWKDNPSRPVLNTLWLKGSWHTIDPLPKGVSVKVEKNGITEISFSTIRAESIQINLIRT